MLLNRPSHLGFILLLFVALFLAWSGFRSYSQYQDLREEWRQQQESSHLLNSQLTHQNEELRVALEAEAAKLAEVEAQIPAPIAADDEPSPFAYVFYATSNWYACATLINIDRLREFGSTLPVHVLVTDEVPYSYLKAFKAANATVHIKSPPVEPYGVEYYRDCFLKLRAFEMHQIAPGLRRVLIFDSDQLVMKNLDHLFTGIPDVDLAAPRAYWLHKDFISTTLMLISLSDRLWETVSDAMDHLSITDPKFDMDLVNDLLSETVLMLGGDYAAINSHWEDWNLPSWYHPQHVINTTEADEVNQLAKEAAELRQFADYSKRRRDLDPEGDHEMDKGVETEEPAATPTDSSGPSSSAPLDSAATETSASSSGSEPETTPPASTEDDSVTTPTSALSTSALSTSAESAESTDTALSTPTSASASTSASSSDSESLPTLPPIPTGPRFPPDHPLHLELTNLQHSAQIIHFFAVGKPWSVSAEQLHRARPDAHPVLGELFEAWRTKGQEICPSLEM